MAFMALLFTNVSAKTMVIVPGGTLFDEKNKSFLDLPAGTRVNTIDELENQKGQYVNYNNKRYFIPHFELTDVKTYEAYESYKESHKPKYKGINTDSAFESVNFKTNQEWFKDIIDGFKPSGNTEKEVAMSFIKYMADLDLTYRLFAGKSQWETIKDGYSACLGGTYIQKQLLDKTSLKYRIVLEIPVNYDNEEEDPYNFRHIFCEIQVDGKWVKVDSTALMNTYDFEKQQIGQRITKKESDLEKMFFRNIVSSDEPEKVGKAVKGNNYYKDMFLQVSGTYQKDKKIKDDGFAVMVATYSWTDFL